MEVTLLDHTANPVVTIGRMAAICYDANTSDAACIRRAVQCKGRGHLSTMRFAYATFNIKGISRTCSHQLVRHPHLSYLQRSQRYTDDSEAAFVTPDFGAAPASLLVDLADHYHRGRVIYRTLVAEGVKKGDARYVLPQAVTTEINVTGNFQAWRDFLDRRLDKAAQWEIRMVAEEIRNHLHEIAKELF